MIILGITHGIDDNMFFGLAQWITNSESYENNYFYLKAKTATTAFFIAHYGAIAGVSAINAINALGVAGAAGKFAVVTSPTGAGAAGGAIVAVGVLATAAGSAVTAAAAGAMMARSVDIYGRDIEKLNRTRPSGDATNFGNGWTMREGGDIINGRRYTQHALEKMAPDTPE